MMKIRKGNNYDHNLIKYFYKFALTPTCVNRNLAIFAYNSNARTSLMESQQRETFWNRFNIFYESEVLV